MLFFRNVNITNCDACPPYRYSVYALVNYNILIFYLRLAKHNLVVPIKTWDHVEEYMPLY